MLDDRGYMREGGGRWRWTATSVLMTVSVAVFALQSINAVYLHTRAESWFALTTHGLRHGWVWQLVTFQFLHGGLFHLFGNLIGYYFLGRFCESALGTRRYLLAVLGSGAAGGVLQGVLMLLFPGHYGTAVVGASAGVFGLLAVFALLQRDAEMRLYFILPIRAMTLFWIVGAVSLFFTLVPAGGVAHAAHLGGLLAGAGLVKLGWHHAWMPLPWETWLARWRERRQARPVPPRPLVAVRRGPARHSATAPPAPASDADFMQREVDPILDKISAHGLQGLTERERRILEKARERMNRR
ncbi:MAG TPA: rhomboid family intramembrane serine protease, partial [Verrucomicrobiota bacterium]|nr:rhomboid family intramembrane serine protease [Verrucomicrobiota bacterium]